MVRYQDLQKTNWFFKLFILMKMIMKFVEIYKIQNDGTQRVMAVCKMVGETVVCEGEDKALIDNLKSEGIWDDSKTPPQKLFPKDGIRFLERLNFVFTSGYLNASQVKEE